MNAPDGVPGCTILECVAQVDVEMFRLVIIVTKYKVQWSGPRTAVPPSPVLGGVSPETPNLWSLRSDLELVTTNEEEVVRSLMQSTEGAPEGDVLMENFAEDLGWELGDAQKRVARAFEPDDDLLVFSDLLV